MTSEIPKKPSSGSNQVFIVLAAIMLVATGGLIVWKFTRSSDDAPAGPATPPPTAEEERVQNAPPPPPPPPMEEPTAAPSAQATNNAVGKGASKSPCSSECKGEVTAALQTALAGRGGAGRRCYEKALAQNATLSGKMTVNVRIAPNGQVCTASVTNDTLQDPGLTNCILGVFRASTLPAPQGGCVEANVPLNFVQSK
ncbi:MAG: AgmX/PglI C-terminal domain-containing protein [Polyangiaceae bacterium]